MRGAGTPSPGRQDRRHRRHRRDGRDGGVGGAGRAPTGLDEAVLAGGTLAYGVALQRLIPRRWHVPANAAAMLASVTFARRAGASFADCGLGRDRLARALGTGVVAAAVVAGAVVAAGVAVTSRPGPIRTRFARGHVTGRGTGRDLYEVLVRIPASTALSEEVLFRGSMLGVMLRRHAPAAAVVRTSVCFGVWHVLPTLASLPQRVLSRAVRKPAIIPAAAGAPGAPAPPRAPGAPAGVLALTTVAGAWFAALRLRSGSVVAPVLAHAALNATAYLVARRAAGEAIAARQAPPAGA